MVEKEAEVPDAATVKKQILETLSKVGSEEKVNFLVNRLVNIDVETSKARNEAKNFKEQTNLIGIVSCFRLF
jgi:HEAT repeat protein